MKITGYEQIVDEITNEYVGFIRCHLDNGKYIDLESYTLLCWIMKDDSELLKYSNKFCNWESLINDLEELNYDLKSQLNKYIEYLPEDLVVESIYAQ
jgi:hypothetical protein